MKSARPTFLSIAITFVLALGFYFAAYRWLSGCQTGRGPWEVMFTNDVAGVPEIVIAQPGLGVSNVHVRFPGEHFAASNAPAKVVFSTPKTPVPAGQLIYDDLMFLPGTVTLDLFGHEVELLPRTLVLNRAPAGWTNNTTHTLERTNKLSSELRRSIKGGYRR